MRTAPRSCATACILALSPPTRRHLNVRQFCAGRRADQAMGAFTIILQLELSVWPSFGRLLPRLLRF